MVYSVAESLGTGSVISGSSGLGTASAVRLGGPLVGKPAPPFSLSSIENASGGIDLRAFAGKPLVVNFFASWCIPCETELPEFAAMARSEKGKVQFVGIDENDSRSAATALIHRSGVTYPVAFDPRGSLVRPYYLLGLPTTLFINSDRVVVAEVAGEVSLPLLASYINGLSSS